MLSFFPRGVLDEILNLIESVSEDFPSYSYKEPKFKKKQFFIILLSFSFFLFFFFFFFFFFLGGGGAE